MNIYTYIYNTCDDRYGEEVAAKFQYDKKVLNIPHVYRVAQTAYKHVVTTHQSQCCVISGDSTLNAAVAVAVVVAVGILFSPTFK